MTGTRSGLYFFLILGIIFFMIPISGGEANRSVPIRSPQLVKMPVKGMHIPVDKAEEIFVRAGILYKEGKFKKSIEAYTRLLNSGYMSGHIFYNLGNAWFKLGELGKAILNYERARLFIPRDPDLRFNLSHALDKRVDAVQEKKGLMDMIFFWLDSFSLKELFWAFAISNILFWTILGVRTYFPSDWIYYLFIPLFMLWIISGISFGLKWYETSTDDRAVIISKEVPVLAGPDKDDTLLFRLHAGTVVHFERREDGWSLIHLTLQKRGWTRSDALGLIKVNR